MSEGFNEFGDDQVDDTRERNLESRRMLANPAALPRADASYSPLNFIPHYQNTCQVRLNERNVMCGTGSAFDTSRKCAEMGNVSEPT